MMQSLNMGMADEDIYDLMRFFDNKNDNIIEASVIKNKLAVCVVN